jgi:hypothetical protein
MDWEYLWLFGAGALAGYEIRPKGQTGIPVAGCNYLLPGVGVRSQQSVSCELSNL